MCISLLGAWCKDQRYITIRGNRELSKTNYLVSHGKDPTKFTEILQNQQLYKSKIHDSPQNCFSFMVNRHLVTKYHPLIFKYSHLFKVPYGHIYCPVDIHLLSFNSRDGHHMAGIFNSIVPVIYRIMSRIPRYVKDGYFYSTFLPGITTIINKIGRASLGKECRL